MTSTPLGPSFIASPDPRAAQVPSARAARTGWFTPTLLSLAALALGLAVQVNAGQYHPRAMPWLTLALLACVAAAAVPNFGRGTILNWRPDQLVLAVALSVQFALLYVTDPAIHLKLDAPDDLAPFKAGVALAAALAAVGVTATRIARFAVPLMLLTYLALGVWLIRSTPAPAVAGPDLHGHPQTPLSLLLELPGHMLGDFRYAQLAALTLAGALIAYARPADRSFPNARTVAAAAMLLFTPRGFAVLEGGWPEPFAALTLAATVFAACRFGRRWALACAASFGLLLASTPCVVLVLPLVLLLPATRFPGRRWGMIAASLTVAGSVVALAVELSGMRAFEHVIAAPWAGEPPRSDALSFLVPLDNRFGIAAPAWSGLACAAAAAALLALWRCPRTPAGFAAAVALVFFAFSATRATASYDDYAFVLAGLCCALAALPGIPRLTPVRP